MEAVGCYKNTNSTENKENHRLNQQFAPYKLPSKDNTFFKALKEAASSEACYKSVRSALLVEEDDVPYRPFEEASNVRNEVSNNEAYMSIYGDSIL
jgi:hypothetical protein